MQVKEVIEDARMKRGISTAELSRRTGIKYQNLWASLNGERSIPAPEFVMLCKELDLSVEDFQS